MSSIPDNNQVKLLETKASDDSAVQATQQA